MKAEIIEYKNNRFAYIIRKSENFIGKNFFGEPGDYLQVGYMDLEKSEKIQPHKHKNRETLITSTLEVLYIISGKMKANFYNDNNKRIISKIIYSGDLIVLLSGAHGFEFIEKTKMIEIKQGPYRGKEKDKVIIKGAE